MTHAAGIYASHSHHESRRDGTVPDGDPRPFGPGTAPQRPQDRDRHRPWATEPPECPPASAYPPPAGARYETPQPLTALERAMPDLREQAVERMAKFNWNHAQKAWERRRRDPLSPHVLLFFYAEPDTTPGHIWFNLRVAARLFLATDEPNLANLLAEFLRATAPLLDARIEPRTPQISNWAEDMPPAAFYLGVGVSSLDTDDVSWQQTQRDATSDMGVPGQCYIALSDATKILVHRRSVNEFGDITVTTNRPHSQLAPARRWQWQHMPRHADHGIADRARWNIWDQLDVLHYRIKGVPHA